MCSSPLASGLGGGALVKFFSVFPEGKQTVLPLVGESSAFATWYMLLYLFLFFIAAKKKAFVLFFCFPLFGDCACAAHPVCSPFGPFFVRVRWPLYVCVCVFFYKLVLLDGDAFMRSASSRI